MNLFPYQIEGADFLANRSKALLADAMGLGKSAQVIRACDMAGVENALVLCPASVRYNWDREFGRFSDKNRPTSLLLSGKNKPRFDGVTICSYDLLKSASVYKALTSHAWDALILDECHYLKGREAKRTKAVFGPRCDGLEGVAAKAKRVWALSGTPAPNDPSELYVLMKAFALWKRPYWDFVARYCQGFDNGFGFQITGAKNTAELKQTLAPIMLRRKKEDVMKDLPPLSYSEVLLDPSMLVHPDDLKAWQEAEEGQDGEALKQALKDFDAQDRPLEDIGLASLRRVTGMAKVRPAAALIADELHRPGGMDKVVVFAIHRDVITYFRECLAAYDPVIVWGGTTPEKRQRNIERFIHNAKCRVFIGNINAAGTGIDGLQGSCAEVVFLESSWTPASNAQAVMRVHRIGQKKPVRVRFMALADSIDERVQTVLKRKTAMLTELFD